MVNTAEAPATPAPSRLAAFRSRATQNPRWFLMDVLSRFATIRRAVRLVQRRPSNDRFDLSSSLFAPIDVASFVADLHRDGFCTGLDLPRSAITTLLEFASEAPCYGDADPRFGFKYADRQRAQQACGRVFSQATYLFWDNLEPYMQRLSNDPLLLSIAAEYLHAEPVMTGSRLWWTFATPERDYNSSITTSFFHYDKDDYTAVRLFFYLTRVDDRHGPHVVVRGSHTNKKVSQLISFGERTDSQIVKTYGEQNVKTIYGEPGAGIAEDPYCFHKATRPVAGDRLMLEIKYATHDYKIFPPADPVLRADINGS